MNGDLHAGWESDLGDLMEQHKGLCAELQLMGLEQSQLLDAPRADLAALRKLTGRRRNVVDRLTRIVQRVEPYRRMWDSAWPMLSADLQTRIAARVDDALGLVELTLEGEHAEPCA